MKKKIIKLISVFTFIFIASCSSLVTYKETKRNNSQIEQSSKRTISIPFGVEHVVRRGDNLFVVRDEITSKSNIWYSTKDIEMTFHLLLKTPFYIKAGAWYTTFAEIDIDGESHSLISMGAKDRIIAVSNVTGEIYNRVFLITTKDKKAYLAFADLTIDTDFPLIRRTNAVNFRTTQYRFLGESNFSLHFEVAYEDGTFSRKEFSTRTPTVINLNGAPIRLVSFENGNLKFELLSPYQ